MVSLAHAEPQPVGTINFGKGLNVAVIPTDIGDNESPDMANVAPNIQGAMSKRYGSKRYISQAISSNPVTSLYKAYASSGFAQRTALIATTRDKILISTGDINPVWVTISSNNAHNQNYSFVTMNRKVLMAGDGQTENTKQFDLLTSSVSELFFIDASTSGVNVRPKYHTVSKNYYIAANVLVSTSHKPLESNTTYYPSRFYYSLLNNPSSMTAQRFIEFKTEDGDDITGIGNMNDAVNIFKGGSIGELTFTNLDLPSRGGDWIFKEVVTGFGCIAPRTLANTGEFYVFVAKDGVRLWDGGRRSRLTVAEESRIISTKIQPLIDDAIKAGTIRTAVGVYYPKNQWYVLSYENPTKFPRGRNNYTLVYDFKTQEWFPFQNWIVGSYAVADNPSDTGQLFYGDGNDGYVHIADLETRTDDSRKEIVLDVMDSSFTWVGSTQNVMDVQEGTASLKVAIGAPPGYPNTQTVTESTMTRLGIFQIGEWYDRTKISKDDKISFKVLPFNLSSVTYLRVDLLVEDEDHFTTNFTSVTLSSGNFTNGNGKFTTFEIPLSSFPTRPDWTSLGSELAPFANTPTYYGIRFVLGGVYHSSCSVDDLRVAQATDNPVKMHRFTKLYNFGKINEKGFGQVVITREKYADSNFFVDVYNDFGQVVRTFEVPAEIPKEIFILGHSSGNNITALNSIDYTIKRQTAAPEELWSAFNGVAGRKHIYFADRTNDRMIKLDRNDMSVFITTYGTRGTGSNQFNLVHQQTMDDKSIFMVDMSNQRVKDHLQTDFSFVKAAGSLGVQATSYHQPAGIAVNKNNVFVADEGNYRLTKLTKSTFGVVLQVAIDYNTIGDTTLQVDEKNLFMAYNKVSEVSLHFQDVILEKRDIGNLSLISRTRITPKNSVANSTYSLVGDMAILGRYIYIVFTDDLNPNNANYYLQKRLKSDFSLVDEFKTTASHYSVLGDGQPYLPSLKTEKHDLLTSGTYLQLKYYDEGLDNSWQIYNQTFLATTTNETY